MVYTDFKDYFTSLAEPIKQEVVGELIQILEKGEQILSADQQIRVCPHCASDKIRANGKTKYLAQKYYCNTCKKHFTDNTNKVWSFVKKKEDMKTYIYGLLSGYSLRRNASECGISLNTSFIWRHKLLRCFDNMSAGEYAGILEIDELFLQHQEALLEQDWGKAQARYAAFHTLLKNHIELEDRVLLPLHQQLEKPQWRSLVYTAEHDKVLEIAQIMAERIAAPKPEDKGQRLRWIIKLIDDERSLKNLLEHHNEREEKGMLPELASLAHRTPLSDS